MKHILKNFLSRIRLIILNITAPLWVRVFKFIAQTGAGTDICIRHGFLPLQIHYYSPVPDLNDLDQRQVWNKKSELVGINFQPDKQVQLMQELGTKYGDECNWPLSPTNEPLDFYTENNSFSFGCAAGLHTIIRHYKPQKVIEIGSGNSSLIISSALIRNKADGKSGEYVIIDLYPSTTIERGLPGLTHVIKERVELTDINRFDQLQENDVLFVDSGHTVRTGGDVNFLFLDILPRLAPGVIVHIHDISLPYEYPKVYFTNPSFRMFWTEAYLLQAFLTFNSQFEVMLAMNYLMTDRKKEFCEAFSHYDPSKQKAISGSFWIRRSSQ
jgi:hypothetical protein